MAACEKRRSGLAPKTTQGPGTKTESSIFGMPNQQVRRAASLSASGRVDGAACAQEYSREAGAGHLYGPPPHQGEQSQAFGCSAHFRDVQMPVEVKSEFIYDP